jgi:hypothetical protein
VVWKEGIHFLNDNCCLRRDFDTEVTFNAFLREPAHNRGDDLGGRRIWSEKQKLTIAIDRDQTSFTIVPHRKSEGGMTDSKFANDTQDKGQAKGKVG